MSARLLASGIVLVLVLLGAAIAGNYLVTLDLISQRQQVWCPLLADITAQRPPPSAPRDQVRMFGELAAVRARLGCPP